MPQSLGLVSAGNRHLRAASLWLLWVPKKSACPKGSKNRVPKKMAYGIIQIWTKIPEVNGYFELFKYLCIAV